MRATDVVSLEFTMNIHVSPWFDTVSWYFQLLISIRVQYIGLINENVDFPEKYTVYFFFSMWKMDAQFMLSSFPIDCCFQLNLLLSVILCNPIILHFSLRDRFTILLDNTNYIFLVIFRKLLLEQKRRRVMHMDMQSKFADGPSNMQLQITLRLTSNTIICTRRQKLSRMHLWKKIKQTNQNFIIKTLQKYSNCKTRLNNLKQIYKKSVKNLCKKMISARKQFDKMFICKSA